MLLEFTDLNCDNKELELLEKIYKVSLEHSVNLKLKPTGAGYIISGIDGELLLEFHDENCDEEELNILKYIYEVSLEHREKLLKEFKK